MPSLKKQQLNLKYPSLGTIPNQPTQHISEELTDFLTDLVENGRMGHKLYTNLSKGDNSLFNRVAARAEVDEGLGLKVDDSEQRELVKRFEILRGEVVAGNDSPQLLKELKTLLLKLIADGTLPKSQGNQLLLEIAAVF